MKNLMMETKFKKGDKVLVSPQVTHKNDWIEAIIVEIEQNPFVGIVVTVETDDKDIYFEKEDMFKLIEVEVCMQ